MLQLRLLENGDRGLLRRGKYQEVGRQGLGISL